MDGIRSSERRRILDELTRIAVSSLDMAEVFDRVGQQVNRLVNFGRLSISTRRGNAGYVEMYAVATDR
jgi:hypothetical protein